MLYLVLSLCRGGAKNGRQVEEDRFLDYINDCSFELTAQDRDAHRKERGWPALMYRVPDCDEAPALSRHLKWRRCPTKFGGQNSKFLTT